METAWLTLNFQTEKNGKMEKFDKDRIFVPKNGKACLMQEFNIWSFAKNVVSNNEWYVRREWRKHRNMLIEEIQKASKQDLSRCLSSLWEVMTQNYSDM